MITMSAGQVIVWVIIGGLAGAIAGMIVKRRKSGFGVISNILIGLVGAFIGGILFDLLDINIAGDIAFTANDLISAIVGSMILLAVLYLIRR
ncbi:MAG: GlsB/YeaQ/YmgE family stress response membrane protein [Phototrophicaceae bacterium]